MHYVHGALTEPRTEDNRKTKEGSDDWDDNDTVKTVDEEDVYDVTIPELPELLFVGRPQHGG
jgi:hypothetical protein